MILPPSVVPIGTYHLGSAPRWLSKTSLRDFDRHGPAWWRRAYLDGEVQLRRRPGGALQGSMLDCYLTEGPEVYRRRFRTIPADAPRWPDRRQREAKKPSQETLDAIAWWNEFNAKNPGETVSLEDECILHDAVAAVRALPTWPEISASLAQHTIRREAKALGLGLQSRPDFLSPERGIVWDLKKTASLASFGKQAIDLGYHLQAAVAGWCLGDDGIALEHAYLVAVEWEPGARARVYEIPQEALVDGDRRMRELAAEIARRVQAQDWSDVQQAPETLPIPGWMLAKMEAA